jgi:hypothetical protein
VGNTRGAGARLAGSKGIEAAVDLTVLGHPSLEPCQLMAAGSATDGISSVTGLMLTRRAVTHDPVWEAKGEAVSEGIERGSKGLSSGTHRRHPHLL